MELTALEKKWKAAKTEGHPIPEMNHPLSKHWDQPQREDILVDDKVAVMSHSTFSLLHEYSTSIPTGVYDGKMWKADDGKRWWLRWYAPSPHPDRCAIHTRLISLV